MPNIVEDAKQAINKLESIQFEFEEENKKINEFIVKSKKTIDDLTNIYSSFETRVDEYLSQLSKINASIKTYNDIQNSAVEEVTAQLELKTKNNLQIAQNNLNSINEELNEYINKFKNQVVSSLMQNVEEKFEGFIGRIDEKIVEVDKINMSINEKIDLLNDSIDGKLMQIADNINELKEENNNSKTDYFKVFIVVLLVVLIILNIINLFV